MAQHSERDDGEALRYSGGKLRLFVEQSLGAGVSVTPGDGQAHYLLHVMRAKPGDALRLFNGHDGEWAARIANVTRRSCTLACERRIAAQSFGPDVWLAFAPIKKTPSDYVVQKATELGARKLIPVRTRRTIVTRVNRERMRANAIEAAEQSDRLDVPEIDELKSLQDLLAGWPTDRALVFCDEDGSAPSIAMALEKATANKWAILTGPEGGFDEVEREAVRNCGQVIPVSLGPRILRADTAALAALSILQASKGDWR